MTAPRRLRCAATRLRARLAAFRRWLNGGSRHGERRRQVDRRVFAFGIILALANAAAFYRVEDTRRDADNRERARIQAELRRDQDIRDREDAKLRAATRRNCVRIHNVVGTLEGIIVDARASLRGYERDGTITRVQLRRGLNDNEDARIRLIGADCPPRKPLG